MSHMTNALATADQLYRRHSYSPLPPDLQDTILFSIQLLTQAAGLLLRLPQSVTAQANVLLARYWLVARPLEPNSSAEEFSDLSAASLFLVAKLGAHPVLPRDLNNVYAYLLSPNSRLFRPDPDDHDDDGATVHTPPLPDPESYYLSESAYTQRHDRVLALESAILAALSFDTHVALPHPLAITYLQALDFLGAPAGAAADRSRIAGRALAHLNAALLSPQLLYLTHQPHALAVAAIYGAARDVGAKMPDCAWWEVFDVDREELGFLVVGMRSVDGWVRARRAERHFGDWWGARGGRVITRRHVDAEMRSRGMPVAKNGALSEEDAMMRSMDQKASDLEG